MSDIKFLGLVIALIGVWSWLFVQVPPVLGPFSAVLGLIGGLLMKHE